MGEATVRAATPADVAVILEVINDGAQAYHGVIAADRWHEPYMAEDELLGELEAGVRFWVLEAGGRVVAVMGMQDVDDVTLVRHAYVRTDRRRRGYGSTLLAHLRSVGDRPMLVGTWRAASWAIDFYLRHGFVRLEDTDAQRLLRRYWEVPPRQIEESVVLADGRWRQLVDGTPPA